MRGAASRPCRFRYGTIVGQTYVKVGHGRDYDDVPPVKGLRRGGGTDSLRVAVTVLRQAPPGESASASTA
jgi:transglutaminase-like putative cysteine protease